MALDEHNTDNLNSVHQTDQHSDEDQINILRDKTFNKELRELVTRIEDNEDNTGEAQDTGRYDQDDEKTGEESDRALKEQELLQDLHRLFYRIKQLDYIGDINFNFNPFDNTTSGLIHNRRSVLQNSLKGIGIEHFAVLSYVFESKSYRVLLSSGDSRETQEIAIGLQDPLFGSILNNRNGFILDESDIKNDIFLRKIFTVPSGVRSLYFVLLNNIIQQLHAELSTDREVAVSSTIPFMILMIYLDGKHQALSPQELAGLIRSQSSIPLYQLNTNILWDFNVYKSNNIADQVNLLEYLVTLTAVKNNGLIYMVSTLPGASVNINNLYIIKYIISKLQFILTNNSIIVYIQNNRFLVFSDETERGTIETVLDDTRSCFKNNFAVHIYRGDQCIDPTGIIKKIMFEL